MLAKQTVAGADPTINSTTSSTLSVGTAGTLALNWLHGLPVGIDPGNSFYYLDVEAQVTSGAGNILCYQPSVTLMNASHGATASGAWATF